MITKLRIDNFKSWRSTKDIRFSKLTGFFGTNSSGKTSLLQLLLLLKQTAESSDRSQVLDLGNEKSFVELGTFKDIIFKHNTEESLEFEIDWNLIEPFKISNPEKKKVTLFEGKDLSFKSAIRQTPQGRMYVDSFSYRFDKSRFRMEKNEPGKYEYRLLAESVNGEKEGFKFDRTQGRAWNLPVPVKCYGFPDQVKAYYTNAGFLSDLQLKFEELFSGVYYLGPLRDYPRRQYTWAGAQPADMGRRGEQVIDALLASRERKKIPRGRGRGMTKLSVEEYVALWLKELGLIDDFKVKQIVEAGNLYYVLVKISSKSPEVKITDVGFGVSQILPVIALCYYVPEGSTLIIEQPEIHLHPKVQAGLADVFIDAIDKKNIQVILESHSEHLLRRLQRRIAEESFSNDDSALYFTEAVKGESILKKLEMDSYGNIKNWDKD
jgi:predicted ATPase